MAKWISRHFAASQRSPEDRIAERVHEILAGDQTLLAVFGSAEWIQRVEVFDPFDFRHFPVLQVTLFSGESTPQPGVLNDEVRLYLAIRYERLDNAPLLPGEASIATLYRHIRTLLGNGTNKLLQVTVGATNVQLVRRSNPGGFSWRPDQDPASGRFAYTHILEWVYEAHVDVTTGKIRNQVLAGG